MENNNIPIPEQPGRLIRRAQQIAVSIFLEETRDFGVTPIQFGVMETLSVAPGLDQVTIASRLGIDPATFASLIDRLEGKGYITREPCAEDRRKKRLSITEAGREIVAAMQPSVAATQKRILEPLAPAERKEFLRLLSKLVEGNNELSRAPMKADA